eukprot:TRINITY_DN11035_c0_g1_i1.p1 TRINITY_DN11035_c0_g1~~TRINITY_DN11035_c0_g1_i1.p1  ORF type:complete len:113 (+),score=3.38 TRINITY_DN11035_c0_g1_i1:136-474(+)
MLFGWFVYSKFIASKIFQMDDKFITPAHQLNDGVDYVPTNKLVLWGHHFTSVAGAAPIVGPAIAVMGLGPCGAVGCTGARFFLRVSTIWAHCGASSRHKGKSMGALSESVIG